MRDALCCVLIGLAALFAGCSSSPDDGDSSVPALSTPSADGNQIAAATSFPIVEDDFAVEDDFTPLTLDDFRVFPEPANGEEPTWRTSGAAITCTGQPRGYAFSDKSYGNFTLRLDYRYLPSQPEAGEETLAGSNTGVLIYVPDEHKVWPASLEVQGKYSEMGQIKSNSRDIAVTIADAESARQSSRKAVGAWNSIEVVSRDGALTSFVNGTKICESEPTELTSGFIGLQSEGFAVQFRRVRIRAE